MAALHSANVALAETEVKGRSPRLEFGTTGDRAKAIEAAAGAVERTNVALEMKVNALFIE